jgi:hypothetical protein
MAPFHSPTSYLLPPLYSHDTQDIGIAAAPKFRSPTTHTAPTQKACVSRPEASSVTMRSVRDAGGESAGGTSWGDDDDLDLE